MMFSSFFASKTWVLRAYGVGIIILLLLQAKVSLNVFLTQQSRLVGDILQTIHEHDLSEVHDCIITILILRLGFVLFDPLISYISRSFAIDWRKAITEDCLSKWRDLSHEVKLEGLSQRIQEEPLQFAQFLENFAAQIIHSIMSLVAFGPMLWEISPVFIITLFGDDYRVEGVLVYVMLGLTVIGLVGGLLFGWKLPKVESDNCAVDAHFREKAVLIENNKNCCTFDQLNHSFTCVHKSYKRMYRKFIPSDWWTSLYWNAIYLIPVVFTAQWVFDYTITLGMAAQITEAFIASMAASSILLSNWRAIVRFSATAHRLHGLYKALEQ